MYQPFLHTLALVVWIPCLPYISRLCLRKLHLFLSYELQVRKSHLLMALLLQEAKLTYAANTSAADNPCQSP